MLLGEEALQRLREAVVVVAGLGGVGAYAAEMTARAGVGRMVLIEDGWCSSTRTGWGRATRTGSCWP